MVYRWLTSYDLDAQHLALSTQPGGGAVRGKMWVHSGDSHVMEPADLFTSRLPTDVRDRAPRTERGERVETIYVDGKVQRDWEFLDVPGLLRDLDAATPAAPAI